MGAYRMLPFVLMPGGINTFTVALDMDTVHVSMASGGAYVGIHAGFWSQLESMPAGRRFRRGVSSYSGSSAGALVGSQLALGVTGSAISDDVLCGGLGKNKYLRGFAVYLGLKKEMYSGPVYYNRMMRLSLHTAYRRVPIQIAVTDAMFEQKCVPYGTRAETSAIVNAAVASASIPWVLPSRPVEPHGLCVDGSLTRSSFPDDAVVDTIRTKSGTLVLLNCIPWPGFRKSTQPRGFMSRLVNSYGNALYCHGMEVIREELSGIKFRDGIFDLRIDNQSGSPVVSDTGNLRVIMVAPTEAQYDLCGGNDSIALLDYTRTSAMQRRMTSQGRLMANEFAVRYCGMEL